MSRLLIHRGRVSEWLERAHAYDAEEGSSVTLTGAMLITVAAAVQALAEVHGMSPDTEVYVARVYPPESVHQALTRQVTLFARGKPRHALVSPSRPLDRPKGYEDVSLMVNVDA